MRENAGFSLRPYRLKPELQRPQAIPDPGTVHEEQMSVNSARLGRPCRKLLMEGSAGVLSEFAEGILAARGKQIGGDNHPARDRPPGAHQGIGGQNRLLQVWSRPTPPRDSCSVWFVELCVLRRLGGLRRD